jgi:hypothetical protein
VEKEEMSKVRKAFVEFTEINEEVEIELVASHSPLTVKAILESLPLTTTIERWGDELYSEPTPIRAPEENAKLQVSLFDVAYWPEGNALCFFYGPTPITKNRDIILPYSPVNIVGTIKTRPPEIRDFLHRVEESHIVKHTPVLLRLG